MHRAPNGVVDLHASTAAELSFSLQSVLKTVADSFDQDKLCLDDSTEHAPQSSSLVTRALLLPASTSPSLVSVVAVTQLRARQRSHWAEVHSHPFGAWNLGSR